ncbi:MAG: hypothetical protein JWL81_1272, partial [Verrucomicrobiales bacterium]|nr:hypothetical protein [Verrucomicrobiales bacterium]
MKLHYAPGLVLVGSALIWLTAGPGFAAPGEKGSPGVPAAKPGTVTVIKAAAAAAAAEKAELVIPAEPLGGSTALEVRFASPMVPAAMVGQTVAAETVLDIKPALKGKFRWQSTRSGSLESEGILPLGTGWKVSVRKGLKNAAGAAVEGGPQVAPAQGFVMRENSPRYFSPASESTRQPEITLFFNDAVNPQAVASAGYFTNKEGARVEASARTPLVGELGRNPPATGTWEQQSTEGYEADVDGPAVSAVRVKPVSPLSVGTDWRFQLAGGIPNAGGGAKTGTPWTIAYGTIAAPVLTNLSAEPVLDGMRELHLNFNKKMAELKPAQWAEYVRISPRPDVLAWEAEGQSLTVKGSFVHGTSYTVSLPAGVPAADGTQLEAPYSKAVSFAAHEPHVSLPAFDHAQWIGGKGDFSFLTANLKKAVVKIKRAQPETVVYLLNGYATYEYDEAHPDSSGNTRLPWAVVPGKTVWEKEMATTVELDHSERFGFNWDEVAGGKREPGIYFVNVEGESKEAVENDSTLGAQAVVQLSDIGLAWKYAASEVLVYAFSHSSGEPLKDVTLKTYTAENEAGQSAVTGADGLAKLPHGKVRWLVAQAGSDLRGVRVDGGAMEMDRWAYDLPVDDGTEAAPSREMMMFTERPVYQPGETVFFKAITRMHQAVTLSFPAERKAKLSLLDPQNRAVFTRDMEFSEAGSFADAVRLPTQGLGWYRLRIDFPKPAVKPAEGAAAAANNEDADADAEEGGDENGEGAAPTFEQMFLVQEYQPNAFRIAFDEAAVVTEAEGLKVPLKASYLMGKSLGAAQLTWTSRLSQAAFKPDGFDDYRFCHARSYYVYDGQQYQS